MTFRFTRGALAAAAACLGLFATTARADLPEFFGNWINNDVNTPDITRIVVMPAGGNNVMVHVWAQCYPTDCDWGVVPGHSYVDTFNQQNVNIVTAQYNPGFARTLVILRTAGGTLRIQALTEFTDGSGRSDYEYRGGLHRVPYFPPVIRCPSCRRSRCRCSRNGRLSPPRSRCQSRRSRSNRASSRYSRTCRIHCRSC